MPQRFVACMAEVFTACLREGVFLWIWKSVRLVLIPKSEVGKFDGTVKARPICLLDILGKLFERIIANRIDTFMKDSPRAALSDRQFGFKRERSTVDALGAVASFIQGV